MSSRYAVRYNGDDDTNGVDYGTLREAENEARRLSEFYDVAVVKITTVGLYKKKLSRT